MNRWTMKCCDNRPYLDWTEIGLAILFCWMAGFRGVHLTLGPIHWHFGFHFCTECWRLDERDHDVGC